MRALVRRFAAVCVPAALLVSLAGCGASSDPAQEAVEQAIETQLGGDAQVDVGDDSITVDTGEGTITAGTGEVPEDFPTVVPLIDGEVTFAQRSASPESAGWTVQITTQTSPDDAAAELTGALQQAGFTVQSSPGQGGTTLLGEGNDLSVLVLVTAAEGATSVLYTVGRQAAE